MNEESFSNRKKLEILWEYESEEIWNKEVKKCFTLNCRQSHKTLSDGKVLELNFICKILHRLNFKQGVHLLKKKISVSEKPKGQLKLKNSRGKWREEKFVIIYLLLLVSMNKSRLSLSRWSLCSLSSTRLTSLLRSALIWFISSRLALFEKRAKKISRSWVMG